MSRRAILQIPHEPMLFTRSVAYWIQRFESQTLRRPTEVVLPAIGYSGATFDSSVYGPPRHLEPGNRLPDWIRQARDALGSEVKVWASVLPTFESLHLESLSIRNQYGDATGQACPVNNVTQRLMESLLSELQPLSLDGYALDVTYILPNSTASTLQGLSNNCFCEYCSSALELAGWRQGPKPFIGAGNISRLILRRSSEGKGAEHIDPVGAWIRDQDAAALLQASEARGFVTIEDVGRREEAERLLTYLRCRVDVTAQAVRRMTTIPRAAGQKIALILGDAELDLAQGADVGSYIRAEAADEYWLPSVPGSLVTETGCVAVAYLFGRATYFINSLFELLTGADNALGGSGGIEGFIQRLLTATSNAGRVNGLNAGAVFAVELTDFYAGFVGVPLGPEDLVRQVEQLSAGTFGQIVPANVVAQIIESVSLAVPED